MARLIMRVADSIFAGTPGGGRGVPLAELCSVAHAGLYCRLSPASQTVSSRMSKLRECRRDHHQWISRTKPRR
jgi:hypothetical protein